MAPHRRMRICFSGTVGPDAVSFNALIDLDKKFLARNYGNVWHVCLYLRQKGGMRMSTLTIYYSYSGNTKRIAQKIHTKIGGDLAEIVPLEPYPDDYDKVVLQGRQEVNQRSKPEILPLNVDLSGYDRILLGTPVWWYTFAPAVRTFLSQYDLSGKTVFPFVTHGGWIGHTEKDIQSACAGASVERALSVQMNGSNLFTPEGKIDHWISKLQ